MSDFNVNLGAGQTPYGDLSGTDETTGVGPAQAPTEAQAAAALNDLASIICQKITVSNVDGKPGASRDVNVPEVDEADLALAMEADLEVLVAYLQMDMDETQVAAAKERIESMKAKLEETHKNQLDKIQDAIDKAREQEKAALAQRIFSWIGAIFAVVAAVVIGVTTGGAAMWVAIAGAVLAVGQLVMSETEWDQDIMDLMAKSLHENEGWSKQDAQTIAQGIFGGLMVLASIGLSVGGGFAKAGEAVVKLSDFAAKAVKIGMSIAGTTLFAGGLGATAGTTIRGYQASTAQADVTDMQATLLKLQKILEENQDDLEQILQLLNDCFSSVMALLDSKIETDAKIINELGQGNA